MVGEEFSRVYPTREMRFLSDINVSVQMEDLGTNIEKSIELISLQ